MLGVIMAQVRMQTECPPDAHKVIRPPEKVVKAILCVKLNESDIKEYGAPDFCSAIALMGAKPFLVCSDELRNTIKAHKEAAQIDPCYLQVNADGTEAHVSYDDGAQGQTLPVVDLTKEDGKLEQFLDLLGTKQYLIIDAYSMLILRSISTVFPWDPLLAQHYFSQFLEARSQVNQDDLDLFMKVRYGRIERFSLKGTNANAYKFLQIESKLFLQYATDDDD